MTSTKIHFVVIAFLLSALGAIGAGSGTKTKKPVPDQPQSILILNLDSTGKDDSLAGLRMIPLPEAYRLNENLLRADTIKARVSKGLFLLEPGDLVSDTGAEYRAARNRAEVVAGFRAYWKKVEEAGGYRDYQKQMESSQNIEKSWVPKILLFDSTVVIIPGYIFLRFR